MSEHTGISALNEKNETEINEEIKFYFETSQIFLHLQGQNKISEKEVITSSKLYRNSLEKCFKELSNNYDIENEEINKMKYYYLINQKILHLSEFMYFSQKKNKTAEMLTFVLKYYPPKNIEKLKQELESNKSLYQSESFWDFIFVSIFQGFFLYNLKGELKRL
jgi:hypothetical protein